jgi:hypothetical protein
MSGEADKKTNTTERASGAELLRRALVHAGVRVMFGHPAARSCPSTTCCTARRRRATS